MKSKTTAVILAIFFGGLGIHHFYLGNTKQGFCYLITWILFCWTFFFPVMLWIIETIEGLILVSKSQAAFDSEYNSNTPRFRTTQSDNYNQNLTEPKPMDSQKQKTEQLLDLKKLYDAGILNEDEFNAQKSKILNS